MSNPQPAPGSPAQNPDQDEKKHRRRWLLLLLLMLLLLVPVCLWTVSQLAVLDLGMDEAHESLLSQLQATYVPWAPANFGPLDPTMIGTIRAEQATFAAGGGGIGILVPFIPGGPGLTQIAANASATPTAKAPPTGTPPGQNTATQIVIYYPATSTAGAPPTSLPPPTVDMATATTAPPPPPPPPPTRTPAPGTADLSISKDDGSLTYTPGAPTIYTIIVSNNGPMNVNNARVRDNFPAQVVSDTWSCSASPGSSCPGGGSGDINVTVDLLNGGTATFTVTANINSSATGSLANTATVTPPASINDPVTGNNSDTDTDSPGSVDLAISKTDGTTTALRGHNVTYTIVVSNVGTADAVGATVTDTLPAQFIAPITWTCASSGSATCSASGVGNISDTVNIPTVDSVTYTLTARLNPSATPGTLFSNTATVAAPGDTNSANDSATDTDTVSDVVVSLTWSSSVRRPDLDLWLVDPSGMIHTDQNTTSAWDSPAGGTLGNTPGDWNCTNFPTVFPYTVTETATWTDTSSPPAPPPNPFPPSGIYYVYAYFNQSCPGATTGQVDWYLTITVDGITTTVGPNSFTAALPDAPGWCPGTLFQNTGGIFPPPTCAPSGVPPYNPLLDFPNYTYTFTVP